MIFDDPFAPKKRRNKSTGLLGDPLGLGQTKKKKRDTRRSFTKTQKNEIWAQQNGKCAKCKAKLDPRTVEYDHKKGWADKGKTVVVNGQALCANCHKIKTHNSRLKKTDTKRKSKPKKPDGLGLFEQPQKGKPKGPFDFGF